MHRGMDRLISPVGRIELLSISFEEEEEKQQEEVLEEEEEEGGSRINRTTTSVKNNRPVQKESRANLALAHSNTSTTKARLFYQL